MCRISSRSYPAASSRLAVRHFSAVQTRALRTRQRELNRLIPRHRASFGEGGVRSLLPESRAGRAEVALAPRLRQRRGMGYAQLPPLCLDGSLEAKRVLVSSEAGCGEGETEDLDRLLHHVSEWEHCLMGAKSVLLGEVVVPLVYGAV